MDTKYTHKKMRAHVPSVPHRYIRGFLYTEGVGWKKKALKATFLVQHRQTGISQDIPGCMCLIKDKLGLSAGSSWKYGAWAYSTSRILRNTPIQLRLPLHTPERSRRSSRHSHHDSSPRGSAECYSALLASTSSQIPIIPVYPH